MVASTKTYATHTFKALGSTITVQAELQPDNAEKIFKQIENCFTQIDHIASRFREDSELTFINTHLNQSIQVSHDLATLIKDAKYAYQITDGKFDPRIFQALNNIGYINTFLGNSFTETKTKPHIIRQTWSPTVQENTVYIGEHPIDLGGIGKSYTVWKASQILDQHTENYYINAGGDITFSGAPPQGKEWTVGVDNPYMETSTQPLAILAVEDESVATSSIAKHSWLTADNKRMHHIIDPNTGLPADNQITAVTTIHHDIITAEIWSKTLFLHTQEEIIEITNNLQLPALWFTSDNKMHYNEQMEKHIRWTV